MYENTKDEQWKKAGEIFQAKNRHHTKYQNHDLGFIFNCSYGNGYRLTGDTSFVKIMTEAGNTLLDRFNPVAGVIKSWNTDSGWQAQMGWSYPVIIDNMEKTVKLPP